MKRERKSGCAVTGEEGEQEGRSEASSSAQPKTARPKRVSAAAIPSNQFDKLVASFHGQIDIILCIWQVSLHKYSLLHYQIGRSQEFATD